MGKPVRPEQLSYIWNSSDSALESMHGAMLQAGMYVGLSVMILEKEMKSKFPENFSITNQILKILSDFDYFRL